MKNDDSLAQPGERLDLQRLMEEGYREMAEENRRIAEESFPETSEMLLKHTQWD